MNSSEPQKSTGKLNGSKIIFSCEAEIAVRSIVAEETLDAIHLDHKLIGDWKGRREYHIESDWLLIYMVESDRVVLERTGTLIYLYPP